MDRTEPPDNPSQQEMLGIFLVTEPKTSENDICLGVIALKNTRIPLSELRCEMELVLADVLPAAFSFMTPDRWPLTDKQEKQFDVSQAITKNNHIHIYRTYNKPRIEIDTDYGDPLGFVFIDMSSTASSLRTAIKKQLGRNVVQPSYQFLDQRSCPVHRAQENKITVLDLACDVSTTFNAHVRIRPYRSCQPSITDSVDGESSSTCTPLKRLKCLMPSSVPTSIDEERRPSADMDGLLSRKQVLLSYVRAESSRNALLLKQALTYLGFSVFLDVDEIKYGVDWQDSLNFAVSNCEVFVPLITERYGETLWTNREVKLADVLSKIILPVNFLDYWPPKPLAIQFATTQYIPGKSELRTPNIVEITDDDRSPPPSPLLVTEWSEQQSRSVALQLSQRMTEQIAQQTFPDKKLSMSKKPSMLRSCAISNLPDDLQELSQPRHGQPLLVICLHPKQHILGEHIRDVLMQAGYEVHCSTDLADFHNPPPQDILPSQSSSASDIDLGIADTQEIGENYPSQDANKTRYCMKFQEKVDEAGLVIFLLSSAFAQSRTCQQQVFYCEHRKHIIALHCEEFRMPGWMTMLLGTGNILDILDSQCDELLKSRVKKFLFSTNTTPQDMVSDKEVQLTSKVSVLRQQLPAEVFVYMSGTTSGFSNNNTEAICRAIGKHLAQLKMLHLATGGLCVVGETTSQSYTEHCSVNGLQSHCYRVMLAGDVQDGTEQTIQSEDLRVTYEKTLLVGECDRERELIVSRLFDIYILVDGGGGSASREAEQFAWNDRLVIPVLCSAGDCNVPSDILKRPCGVCDTDWRMLSNRTASPDQIGQAVARIVSVVREKIKVTTARPCLPQPVGYSNTGVRSVQGMLEQPLKSPLKQKSSLTKDGTLLLDE